MLKKPDKPLVKPYADYPLTPHSGGYWVRKIKGKTHYIGARWASPDEALTEWNRVKETLLAGLAPLPLEDTLTVKDALNHFLCDCKSKVARGDLVQRTYRDYVTVCKHTVKTLGANTAVMSLNSRHFAELRNSFPGQSPNTISNWVVRTKVAFNWLHNPTLVEKPFSFGNSFKKP
ncbi:MAG TPA: hypothetical protein VM260_18735, partial [Pirellula sp.]|nr:hypothetical protein [Pirellula sp.]